jgi:hypothetical protein
MIQPMNPDVDGSHLDVSMKGLHMTEKVDEQKLPFRVEFESGNGVCLCNTCNSKMEYRLLCPVCNPDTRVVAQTPADLVALLNRLAMDLCGDLQVLPPEQAYERVKRAILVYAGNLQQQLVEAKRWKEEDPRMLREQIRVADIAFQELFEQHKKSSERLATVRRELEAISCAKYLYTAEVNFRGLFMQCEEIRKSITNV